jgi:hypothetical protein
MMWTLPNGRVVDDAHYDGDIPSGSTPYVTPPTTHPGAVHGATVETNWNKTAGPQRESTSPALIAQKLAKQAGYDMAADQMTKGNVPAKTSANSVQWKDTPAGKAQLAKEAVPAPSPFTSTLISNPTTRGVARDLTSSIPRATSENDLSAYQRLTQRQRGTGWGWGL